MNSLLYQELFNGQTVEVLDIGSDIEYARDCFDGTNREWEELLQDAGTDPQFFLVSLGMPGYTADNVSVYTNKADALSGARFWIENDEDMREEESQ